MTIPLAALAFTYLGATRGLKIMRFTLYAQWIGQPIGWIVFTLAMWAAIATTARVAVGVRRVVGARARDRLVRVGQGSRRFPESAPGEGIPEERTGALLRFGGSGHRRRCSAS